jgi:hypothetical protein
VTALATIADYEDITGATVASGDETTRITRLLELNSSAVLAGAHGQLIAQTTNTDLLVQPFEGIAYLPQRPVISITSVVADGVTLTAGTDYRFEAGGNGRPAKLIRRVNGHDSWWTCELTVTYMSGWATIPGQIIGIVVAMTVAQKNNGGAQATTQRTVGPFSSSSDTSESQAPSMALTPSAQDAIDRLCKAAGHASVQLEPEAV